MMMWGKRQIKGTTTKVLLLDYNDASLMLQMVKV